MSTRPHTETAAFAVPAAFAFLTAGSWLDGLYDPSELNPTAFGLALVVAPVALALAALLRRSSVLLLLLALAASALAWAEWSGFQHMRSYVLESGLPYYPTARQLVVWALPCVSLLGALTAFLLRFRRSRRAA